MKYLFAGFGGALGALVRYGLSRWISSRWDAAFPVATFVVNIAGSFLLGYFTVQFADIRLPDFYQAAVTNGFLGALTTYSAFSFELIKLYQEGKSSTAVLYLMASLAAGFLAAYGGIAMGYIK